MIAGSWGGNGVAWLQCSSGWLAAPRLFGLNPFIWSFGLKGGLFKTESGLFFVILKMAYFTQVYCKWRELQLLTRNDLSAQAASRTVMVESASGSGS